MFEDIWDFFICNYPSTLVKGTPLIIRVYFGGIGNPQTIPFTAALGDVISELQQEYILEQLTLREVREIDDFTPTDLVNWLAQSHVHFIVCHPHQGTAGLNWDVTDLYQQLNDKLYHHPGFPSGDQLKCPIFTQDKFEYLSMLQDLANPTLKVTLNPTAKAYSGYIEMKIRKFMQHPLCTKESKGFIWKAPFVTNSLHYRVFFDGGTKAAIKILQNITDENFSEDRNHRCYKIPYMMLQPTMANRMEYKVVCLGGKACFIARTGSRGSGRNAFSFGTPPHSRLFAFAEASIQRIMERCPSAIVDGLIRVAIFETKDEFLDVDGQLKKKWVVNELEGFEAAFGSNGKNEANVNSFLKNYWINKIKNSFLSIKTMCPEFMIGDKLFLKSN